MSQFCLEKDREIELKVTVDNHADHIKTAADHAGGLLLITYTFIFQITEND